MVLSKNKKSTSNLGASGIGFGSTGGGGFGSTGGGGFGSTGGGGFGSTSTTTTTNTTTGTPTSGGGFGTTGGGFGSTTGGGFGSTSGGFGTGTSTAKTGTSGGFGSTSGGGFGSTSGGGFGSTSGGGFGSTSGGGFGSTSGGGFGSTSGGGFGSTSGGSGFGGVAGFKLGGDDLLSKTGKLDKFINEISCKYEDRIDSPFMHIFYDLDSPGTNHPQVEDYLKSRKAYEKNPDPARLTPVLIRGDEQLQSRLKQQMDHAEQQKQTIQQMEQKLLELQKENDRAKTRQLRLKEQHLILANQVLVLLGQVECIQAKGLPLQTTEENFRYRLEQIQKELNSPGVYKSALNEISATLMQEAPEGGGGEREWDVETTEKMQEFLKQQHEGIMHLVDIINEDMADAERLVKHLDNQSRGFRGGGGEGGKI